MPLPRRRASRNVLRAGAGAAVTLLIGTAALAAQPGSHDGTSLVSLTGSGAASETAPSGSPAVSSASFTISGDVGDLYPGVVRWLTLTVANHESFAIVVTSLTVTVGAARATCGASNLTVQSFSGQLKVQAGGKASTKVHISMAHSAPNACQGVVFPLHYEGLARKAS